MFATEIFRKGDFIAEYWGRKLNNAQADARNSKYLFELNSRWTIDGSRRSNTARYINHSCKPNAEPDVGRGKIIIRAKKTINPGDEITYNYGQNYFKAFIKPIGCACMACASAVKVSARPTRRKTKVKQTKVKQTKVKQSKVKQSKAKQSKAKQSKVKQSKVKRR